jgi:hypothetical protein
MSTEKLQDVAASVIKRGQITFGDVRRLQRDCLPGGITNREDAETLVALSHSLVRADKAWAQWLVAALARWLVSQAQSDVSIQDAAKAWLAGLTAASSAATPFGRRIGRHIRRELVKLVAPETEPAQEPAADVPRPLTADQPCPAPAARAVHPVARCRPAPRAKRKAAPLLPLLPVEIWQVGAMQKHLRFQLERPCM